MNAPPPQHHPPGSPIEAFRAVVRANEDRDPLALARARRDLAQLGYVVNIRTPDRRPPGRAS